MDFFDLEKERLRKDPQEAKICLKCDKCNSEIYEGEEYYCYDGIMELCEDCFDEMQSEEKRDCERIAGDDDGD